MSVFIYKVISISDRNPNRLPKIKKTKLKPIEKIKQISKELPAFLEDRNDAKVEIDDIKELTTPLIEAECSLKVTTIQSKAEVDVAVDKCISGLDLEYAKK